MITSSRRPAPDPLITRQYDPSRLQKEPLSCAYQLLIPIISRRLSSHRCRPGDPGEVDTRVGDPRPSVAGA
jgi:hypothetical protein